VFLTAVVFTYAKSLLDALLGCFSARPAAALLVTPKVELFSGSTVPGPNSAYGDFTRALFTGYAPVALTLSAPINPSVNTQAVIGNALFSIPGPGPITPDTATGYIITDGVSIYYGGERFAAPVNFTNIGDFLDLNVALPLPVYSSVAI
jgi:hypothetical protein